MSLFVHFCPSVFIYLVYSNHFYFPFICTPHQPLSSSLPTSCSRRCSPQCDPHRPRPSCASPHHLFTSGATSALCTLAAGCWGTRAQSWVSSLQPALPPPPPRASIKIKRSIMEEVRRALPPYSLCSARLRTRGHRELPDTVNCRRHAVLGEARPLDLTGILLRGLEWPVLPCSVKEGLVETDARSPKSP